MLLLVCVCTVSSLGTFAHGRMHVLVVAYIPGVVCVVCTFGPRVMYWYGFMCTRVTFLVMVVLFEGYCRM